MTAGRVQYSDDLISRRKQVTVGVDLKRTREAMSAWKWAYETHRVDEPSFGDWVNALLRTRLAEVQPTAPTEGRQPRMYWIDRDLLADLDAAGENRSAVFRGLIDLGAAELEEMARRDGEEIPQVKRLPNKVYRS